MNSKFKNSHSISETTRKVFFISNTNIKPPSGLFVPALITAKGLYPPSIILLKALLDTNNPANIMIPRKSCSVPVKLITMQEHSTTLTTINTNTTTTTTTAAPHITIRKSQSTPPSPTATTHHEAQIYRPASIETIPNTTIKPTRTPMKKWVLKKKKPSLSNPATSLVKTEDEDEEDEPMTKPMSITEKRKRQAKRADQVKIWKVREEREAREARLLIRRQMVNGNKKITQSNSTSSTSSSTTTITTTATTTTPNTIRKKKKRVKFNFDRNSIIELPSLNDDLQDI